MAISAVKVEFTGDYPFTPSVRSVQYQNLTYSSCDFQGKFIGVDADVTACGFEIDTVDTFATAVDITGTKVGTTKVFNGGIEDLEAETLYYVRGYVTVDSEKQYSGYWTIITPVAPILGAVTFSDLTDVSFVLNGSYDVTLDTGDSVGFVYDTSADFDVSPVTISDAIVDTGAKTFSKSVTGLDPGETYYVKAFIIIVGDTSYGDVVNETMNWSITITPPSNGSITADPESVADGGDTLLTFTPSEGY